MTHSSSVARRALSGNGRQHHWSGYTPETAYYLKEISEEEVVRWGGGGGEGGHGRGSGQRRKRLR